MRILGPAFLGKVQVFGDALGAHCGLGGMNTQVVLAALPSLCWVMAAGSHQWITRNFMAASPAAGIVTPRATIQMRRVHNIVSGEGRRFWNC